MPTDLAAVHFVCLIVMVLLLGTEEVAEHGRWHR